ncbi:hypothetical protein [Streptomyces apocyni]|uniref:hypothetical protein n=1 Tax=Streptomyces apocyni TaxID=2654677 RepID=UPI0012EA817F|nr:hypothetical protein [Streptomyces apocyni]
MANPGYGKRSAPDQRPRSAHDFAHLPPREAAIAAYIDRLPDGADISVKTLAKVLPYGQCALSTALRRLRQAGHLRQGSEHHFDANGSPRWVTRTWFSRTARDDPWWAAFAKGDAPPTEDRPRPTRSRAYILLAALGRTDPVMSLSAADCSALAPLVTQWFDRGASDGEVVRALTEGLPVPVHHPAALARTRLTTKLPPERPRPARAPAPLRILECATCHAPGRPEALPGGECADCRGGPPPPHPRRPGLPPAQVHAYATQARQMLARQELARPTKRSYP